MNKIYRILWNDATHTWVAVAEIARSQGKRARGTVGDAATAVTTPTRLTLPRLKALVASLAFISAVSPAPTWAQVASTQLPTGGNVVAGTATITQSAAVMTVNQTTTRAAIDWATFNVGSAAQVNFNQPSSSSVTLNRVLDSNPSQIFGRITAPGQVFLTNPNGVFFAPGASVDVGGLVATTHRIGVDDFMAGRTTFERNGSTGSVVNEGELKAALGGYIALLAPEVRNEGVIIAEAGTVALASGEVITLNFADNGTLAGITATQSQIAALVENKNAVLAPGGLIILSAQAVNSLQGGVITHSGTLSASSLTEKGGRILLEGDHITLADSSQITATGATGGGEVLVGGDWQGGADTAYRVLADTNAMKQATTVTMEAGASIDVSATKVGAGGTAVLWSDVSKPESVTTVAGTILAKGGTQGGNGGFVETSGARLDIADSAHVSTTAAYGATGQWLLDPVDFYIGGGSGISGAALGTALNSNSVTIDVTGGSASCTNATCAAGSGSGGIIYVNDNVTWTDTNSRVLALVGTGVQGSGMITMPTNAVTTFNLTGTSTYSGILAGAGRVIKEGTGTLVLNGTNTYTGLTNVNAGTLAVTNNSGLGGAASFSQRTDVATGATLDLRNVSIGNEEIDLTGTATLLTSTGTSSLSGVVFLSGLTTNVSVSSGAQLTISGEVTDDTTNTTLNKLGAGTLILTNNTAGYNSTNIDAGVLQIGNGGTSGVLGSANVNINTSGTLAYNRSDTLTLSKVISGAGAFSQLGSGTLTLDGTNTYTGGTNINAGTLSLGSADAIGTTGTISFGGGILQSTASNTTDYSSRFSSAASQQYKIDTNGQSLTLATGLGSSNGSLQKLGTGTLTLSGSSSYTGATTITAGTLALDGTGTIATSSGVANNSAFSIGGNKTIDSMTGSGTTALGGSTLTIGDATNTSATYSGIISGTGALIKAGSGTLTLGGVNTYTGATTISAGTLALNGTGTIATSSGVANSGNFSIAGDKTIDSMTGSGTTALGSSTLTIGDATNTSATYSGIISGTGALTKAGTGTLTLGGVNTYTGATTINAGTLTLNSTGTIEASSGVANNSAFSIGGNKTIDSMTGSGTTALGGSTLTIGDATNTSATYSGIISGTGALTKAGSGTLTLGGDNSYTGATNINAGTLQAGHANALGTTAGNTVVASGATLAVTSGITIAEPIQLSGTGVSNAGALNLLGTNTFSGNITLAADTSIVGATGTQTISGTIDGAHALTMTSAGDWALNGNIGTGTQLTGLSVKAAGSITQATGTSVNTNNGNIIYWSDSDNSGSGGVRFNGTASINTNGGHLWIGGGSGTTTWNGLTVGDGYAVGTGGTTAIGIYFEDGSGSLNAAGGNISLRGKGSTSNSDCNNAADCSWGVTARGTIQTSGSGSITIDGVGGAGTGTLKWGVRVQGTVQTNSGAITISGVGGQNGSSADGIALHSGSVVSASGPITLTGTKGGGTGVGIVTTAGTINGGSGNVSLVADTMTIGANISGTGTLSIAPNTSTTTIGIAGGAGDLALTSANFSTNFVDGFSSITIGRNDGTGKITASAFTVADNLTLLNTTGGIELTGALNAGSNTLTLNSTGTISDTGSGAITAGSLALLNASSVTLDATTNNVGTLASSGTGALTYVDSNALTIGTVNPTGITATGQVNVATLTGDLTVSENISTTDTSTGAIILNAGKSTAAGTSTGGNLLITGSPTITVGTNGRATLYSGGISSSTGLTTLIGSGSDRFRYNSDETTTNYTTALATGRYAIYREQPSLSITASDTSKVFDGAGYSGGAGVAYSGFVNGDTSTALGGTLSYAGSSQGAIAVGTYVITPSGLSNGLGYALAYANGTLEITPAPATTPSTDPTTPTTPTIIPPVVSTIPVVLIVPSSGGLVEGNSTADGGAAAGAAGASGISISLDNSPADGSTNQSALTEVVTVLVPRSMTTSGTGFRFELPAQIRASLGNGEVAASLAEGSALPEWISFDPTTVSFTSTAVPDRGLPLRVRISTAVRQILVIVSERNE